MNSRLRARWVLFGFSAILLLAGCSGCTQIAAQAPPEGLGGTSWQLVRFRGGDDTVLTPDDRSKYTVAFAVDGNVSARLDCNRGRATWKSSGPGQLELGPLALTRAACPPGSLHDRMVKHWSFIRSYLIRDGRLHLSLMADGGIYEFEPIATKAAEPLENTYWKLTQLGAASITVAASQQEAHILLHPDTRRVTGSGGCNRLSGSYELNGDQLSFGRMAGTMMACQDGMDTERAFLDALQQARMANATQQQLELFDAAGNGLARFEARHMK